MEFNPTQVLIKELLHEIRDVFSTLLSKKNILLKLVYEEKMKITIDRRMIASVIRNLLSNAIKFTPTAGVIGISVQEDESGAHFRVTDTGIGIRPDNVKRILREGHTQSEFGTEGEHGSGIGYRIVHKFLVAHGSELDIQSEPGKGTTTSFTLPPLSLD